MIFQHTHKYKTENLYIYLNDKKVLTIKNIQKMATLSIQVDDNQADLDAIKKQVADASAALAAAITSAQAALADLEVFQISFNVSIPPTA